ncbi:MAG: rhodanese-like domain-containing protein, partial [Chthoniobacterales bacterium]
TGFIIPGEKAIVLVVSSAEDARKARLELSRIGFDNVLGYVKANALRQTEKLPQVSPEELKASLKNNGPLVVDVRTPSEWQSNHIEGARHLPLSTFAQRAAELPNDCRIAVICGSGYRSSVASSLLQSRGYKEVENVAGGMNAYMEPGN